MFIHCYDKDLKMSLLSSGYKLSKGSSNQDYWIFFNKPDGEKFDFNKIDKSKFKLSNKLTF